MSATMLCSLMTYFYNNFHTWEVLYFHFMDIEIEALSNFMTFMISLLVEHGFRVRHPDQKTILVFLLICCVSLDKVGILCFLICQLSTVRVHAFQICVRIKIDGLCCFQQYLADRKRPVKTDFCMIRIISMYPGISDSKSQALSLQMMPVSVYLRARSSYPQRLNLY